MIALEVPAWLAGLLRRIGARPIQSPASRPPQALAYDRYLEAQGLSLVDFLRPLAPALTAPPRKTEQRTDRRTKQRTGKCHWCKKKLRPRQLYFCCNAHRKKFDRKHAGR